MLKIEFIILIVIIGSIQVFAANEPDSPKKQTPWKLYLDSKEAYSLKKELKQNVLFIDVRDPIEIMFTGFTDIIDINIPFKLADRNNWNDTKNVFLMVENTNFENQVYNALKDRDLSKDTAIIIMCRSGGTRGAPCANKLWGKGYSKVYVVVDGFEGAKATSGERKGQRVVNGWKNSGLPWSYKLNKAKIYFKQH